MIGFASPMETVVVASAGLADRSSPGRFPFRDAGSLTGGTSSLVGSWVGCGSFFLAARAA